MATDPKDEITIADAVKLMAEAMDFNGEIVFDDTRADGQFQKTCSNARLRAMRPSFEFIPIRQGIIETVAWFVENYETCRR